MFLLNVSYLNYFLKFNILFVNTVFLKLNSVYCAASDSFRQTFDYLRRQANLLTVHSPVAKNCKLYA